MHLYSKKLILSLLLFSSLLIPIASSNPSIGINYSQHPASDLRHPDRNVSTVRSLGVSHVRVLDPDPDIVHPFSNSGISILSIPNTFIHAIAANRTEAIKWLYSHVVPFYPRAHITAISVGNDVLTSFPELSTSLLSAIWNVYLALQELGIRNISVSTAHSFDVITSPFPPSAAEFQEPITGSIMKPLLNFLSTTNSPFLINAYPYDLYRKYPDILIGR
ncbi:glucan endo-1,3-beta-glucosidase 11-like [Magnolia sinica]|uniref:glucan endo-1,3-beta-glucosidase 11-like n=1 Tax=Magnolia sinica TaxID=86752 RepID=UPI00265ADF52|nr:glucan endo-1,3-beta-glucosidase 11-like [Magnolia sinica]